MSIPEALDSFREIAESIDAKLEKPRSLWWRWQIYAVGVASWAAGLYVGHRFIP